jgi:predicted DNA-binding transcriptional regulator AlpA
LTEKEQHVTSGAMLDTHQVADRLGVSSTTVRKWRMSGDGPPWLKLPGGTVRYDPGTLAEWIESRRRESTTDGLV